MPGPGDSGFLSVPSQPGRRPPTGREGMPVAAGGRLRQGQAPSVGQGGEARTWLWDEEADV